MSRELEAGAEYQEGAGYIYVDLRAGEIAQTRKEPADGFVPRTTRNKAGTEFHFFAKPIHHITGYVTDIRWHQFDFQSGGSWIGWKITIDAKGEIYVLSVGSKDRPYSEMMNRLLAVDFSKLVYFRGYTNSKNGNKNLIISQEMDDEGKPIWVEPLYQSRWMSLDLKAKIKNGVQLTDEDKKNVKYDDKGQPDNSYPYIIQKADGKWSFDRWEDFLITLMNDEVIPNVKQAAAQRAPQQQSDTPSYTGPNGDANEPVTTAPAGAPTAPPDDDIPF